MAVCHSGFTELARAGSLRRLRVHEKSPDSVDCRGHCEFDSFGYSSEGVFEVFRATPSYILIL